MRWLTVLICVWCANGVWCVRHPNNVCRDLLDYETMDHNKNCWYNPDVASSPKLIAKRYGYPFERHLVTTKDGYVLSMDRIPRSPNEIQTDQEKQPILLQHGLATTSVFWMLQGNRSLAFFLVDNGYDVWMPSSRGTYYSTKHVSLTMEDPEYWNFGFHEMAIYDLPACIDFIANRTGEKGNLIYVGHSMGTTSSFIYSIDEREHAEENVKAIISLAPVAYMGNVLGTFKLLAPSAPILAKPLKSAGIYAIAQNHPPWQALLGSTCSRYPLIIACNLLAIFSAGISVEQFQAELLPVFFSYYPAGISIKTLEHFAQLVTSKSKFSRYDYGPEENMKVYNSTIAPEYNVSEITLPVYLFVGSKDIVADFKDARILQKKINLGKSKAEMYMHHLAHNDQYLAKDPQPFYDDLLKVIKMYSI